MRIFHFFVLIFFVSCSVGNNETLESPEQIHTYFDDIFTDSDPVFNGKKLGENLSKDIVQTDSLSGSDYFVSFISSSEGKLNEIEVDTYIESDEKRNLFIEKVVTKYNVLFKQNKPVSKFVTWSYTTKDNSPAKVSLLIEKEFNTVSLNIGYRAQR